MSFAPVALALLAALRFPGPLSPRNASYQIKATLDAEHKTVEGAEHLVWRNLSSGTAHELVFHLYMNAFKNESSTFMRESRGQHRRSTKDNSSWGAIDLRKVSINGIDSTTAVKVDDTLATIPLGGAIPPVPPGGTIELDIAWKVTLPKIFARAGYDEDFFAVAQWFPKIAVFECDREQSCRWRAHQYHLNSEFFADYGVYDVDLDVPKWYEVAATGIRTHRELRGDRALVSYHAEDVHDFAFAACPHFRLYEDSFVDHLGPVRVVLYSIAGHEDNAPRHLRATIAGLAELERRFGPYPYSQISVVDVPEGAEGAGGMEYPTLFFTANVPSPRGLHLPELVTIHELSHQYFYGLVGSDEVEEAWLDEGLTEAATDWGLERMFGGAQSFYGLFGHQLSATEADRLEYRIHPDIDPPATRSFQFLDSQSYAMSTYRKIDLVLRTVEGLIGQERFLLGMRHYFEASEFGHPRGDDFVRLFDEGAGEDLGWFWPRMLLSSEVLDYEVLSVDVREKHIVAGLFDLPGGERKEVAPADAIRTGWTSDVVVHRKGEVPFPVELRVRFQDGSERRESWDDRGDGPRWKRFSYEGPLRVVSAEVDPEGKVALDVNRMNNGRLATANSGPRRRVSARWQLAVSTLFAALGF